MCTEDGNVTILCAEHVREMVDAYLAKYPRARELAAQSKCGRCHEADEIAAVYGWDAAWEWDGISFLIDGLAPDHT